MPSLAHSVPHIIQQLLVDLGVGTDYSLVPQQAWPVYRAAEPDAPDNVLTVYRTTGRLWGFQQLDGSAVLHRGFQIRIRLATPEAGEVQADAVAVALDEEVKANVVTLDSVDYCIAAITRTADVASLGRDPNTRRFLYTLNATVVLRQIP